MLQNKILILGASGFIGKHLYQHLGPDRAIATYNKNPVDNGIFFDATSMRVAELLRLEDHVSHAVILLGMTNPNTCVERLHESTSLNVNAIKNIIDELLELKIKPVFISTESVFDGMQGDYVESDPAHPILTYGRQKLEVENYLDHVGCEHTILRLSNVLSDIENEKTLFISWLQDFKTKDSILCADDQRFSPVFINDVIQAIELSIEKDLNGTFHVAGPEGFTRLQLLKLLISNIENCNQPDIEIKTCSIHDFPTKEKRPVDVSMLADKFVAQTGFSFLHAGEICKRAIANSSTYY